MSRISLEIRLCGGVRGQSSLMLLQTFQQSAPATVTTKDFGSFISIYTKMIFVGINAHSSKERRIACREFNIDGDAMKYAISGYERKVQNIYIKQMIKKNEFFLAHHYLPELKKYCRSIIII